MLERTLESPRVDGEVGRQVAVGKGVADSESLAKGGKTVGEKVSGCIVASLASVPLLTAGESDTLLSSFSVTKSWVPRSLANQGEREHDHCFDWLREASAKSDEISSPL